MYFSVAAPQNVTLPDGKVLSFRVNAQDSSLCEVHVIGEKDGVAGTHILTFKRNGSPSDTTFVATPVTDGLNINPKPTAPTPAPAPQMFTPTPAPQPVVAPSDM